MKKYSKNIELRNVYEHGGKSCIPRDKEHAIDRFRSLATERSQCHLNVLEAVFIKSLSPSMCLLKENVKKLILFR